VRFERYEGEGEVPGFGVSGAGGARKPSAFRALAFGLAVDGAGPLDRMRPPGLNTASINNRHHYLGRKGRMPVSHSEDGGGPDSGQNLIEVDMLQKWLHTRVS
jgi:hypothetical protein